MSMIIIRSLLSNLQDDEKYKINLITFDHRSAITKYLQ